MTDYTIQWTCLMVIVLVLGFGMMLIVKHLDLIEKKLTVIADNTTAKPLVKKYTGLNWVHQSQSLTPTVTVHDPESVFKRFTEPVLPADQCPACYQQTVAGGSKRRHTENELAVYHPGGGGGHFTEQGDKPRGMMSCQDGSCGICEYCINVTNNLKSKEQPNG